MVFVKNIVNVSLSANQFFTPANVNVLATAAQESQTCIAFFRPENAAFIWRYLHCNSCVVKLWTNAREIHSFAVDGMPLRYVTFSSP